jgi:nucleotide-binding universal stress UspA family protein
MKILCATDFTPRARIATNVALELARITSGSVELFHVVATRTADMLALAADAGVLEEYVRRDAEARLAALEGELATTGLRVTSAVEEGDVESEILARAKQTGPN